MFFNQFRQGHTVARSVDKDQPMPRVRFAACLPCDLRRRRWHHFLESLHRLGGGRKYAKYIAIFLEIMIFCALQ